MKLLKKLTMMMTTVAAVALMAGTSFATTIFSEGFEAGNSGFSSAYTYHALSGSDPDNNYGPPLGLYEEGYYTVGSNPSLYHSSWASFGAHSGKDMMIVNGDRQPNVQMWAAPVTVTPGQEYVFSAWLASVYPAVGEAPISPATLAFSINGTQIGGDFTLSSPVGTWQQFSQVWTADETGLANISIINRNTEFAGNDFALDDIAIDQPVPEPGTMLLLGVGMLGLGVFGKRRAKKEA